ncbi:hypothetical protein K7432_015080 [Basidiobolus ranarum]|uniref:Uncharacterized protein n=1 Tax=Basidiobolus ranarum TaxID=34480 RepID=A0ABR2VNJ8_9FUNG
MDFSIFPVSLTAKMAMWMIAMVASLRTILIVCLFTMSSVARADRNTTQTDLVESKSPSYIAVLIISGIVFLVAFFVTIWLIIRLLRRRRIKRQQSKHVSDLLRTFLDNSANSNPDAVCSGNELAPPYTPANPRTALPDTIVNTISEVICQKYLQQTEAVQAGNTNEISTRNIPSMVRTYSLPPYDQLTRQM